MFKIKSVCDIGCGDWQFSQYIDFKGFKYTGIDCVKSVIDENKKKPLTDQELSGMMKKKGYIIARRTIAKYREQLEIPVARLRKEL